MNRRAFLQSMLASSALSASGCALHDYKLDTEAYLCTQRATPDDILRIDMHTHLINHDDVNAAAFLVRRYVPDNIFMDLAAGLGIRAAVNTVNFKTDSLAFETNLLRNGRKDIDKQGWVAKYPGDEKFCRIAHGRQRGYFLADSTRAQSTVGAGRPLGFATNRLRNAAMLMSFWPKVDIFMPLMVDFYEGRDNSSPDNKNGRDGTAFEHPADQAEFYRYLHLATRGRFMPLISFNPERQIKQDPYNEMTPLDLVRRAIDEWGFIGVKVHPTAGFDPLDNKRWGCPNAALQPRKTLSEEEGDAYNQAMRDLYTLCVSRGVPIVTHGSDSLSAHEACMHGTPSRIGLESYNQRFAEDPKERIIYRDPATWTNSAHHWAKLLTGEAPGTGLNVCLAHYASRFQDHLAAKHNHRHGMGDPRPYHKRPDNLPRVEYDKTGQLVPSAWLARAMKEIKADNKRMWLDLSHMTQLCYSEAALQGREIDRSSPFADSVDDGGRYALAFRDHLANHPELHSQIMYGSDWHMPEVSTIGQAYLPLMEGLLPNDSPTKENIMGRNAVQFFGLHDGMGGEKPRNRARLEDFYRRNGIDLSEVGWMKRIDSRMALL